MRLSEVLSWQWPFSAAGSFLWHFDDAARNLFILILWKLAIAFRAVCGRPTRDYSPGRSGPDAYHGGPSKPVVSVCGRDPNSTRWLILGATEGPSARYHGLYSRIRNLLCLFSALTVAAFLL